jgi:hypothetical protein
MSSQPQPPAKVPEKVTRADIEAKLQELKGGVDTRVQDAKFSATVVAVAIVTAAVVVAYFVGNRRNRKRQTVFEIRRI